MNLISKKDLLAITGISYGQLYRWKRERLIPEEWFIKQSAYTGQETFFPREQILSRIKSILDLKDKYSLEELAKMLSPETSVEQISMEDLNRITEIDQKLIYQLNDIYGKEQFDFYEVTLMAAISKAVTKLGLSSDQAGDLLSKSITPAMTMKNINITCIVMKVADQYHTLFTQSSSKIELDTEIEVVEQIHLSEITDKIKMKYKNLFIN